MRREAVSVVKSWQWSCIILSGDVKQHTHTHPHKQTRKHGRLSSKSTYASENAKTFFFSRKLNLFYQFMCFFLLYLYISGLRERVFVDFTHTLHLRNSLQVKYKFFFSPGTVDDIQKGNIILLPQFNSRQSIKFNILDWCTREKKRNGIVWFSVCSRCTFVVYSHSYLLSFSVLCEKERLVME